MKHFRYDFEPTPRQHAALALNDFAVLFGGALGGGKTEFLLQCISYYSEIFPGARMGMLRRNYKELMQSGGLLDRAETLWADQPGVKYRKSEKVFIAPNHARVEFRHCERAGDERHLQGAEYDVLLVDEASLFLPDMLSYFMERLRGHHTSLYRLGSNPGGPSHDWLNKNFRSEPKKGFAFVPSLAKDNPHLPLGYFERLEDTMDGLNKRHRLYGDWDAAEDTEFFGPPIVSADDIPACSHYVRSWDMALGGDNTVGTLVGKHGTEFWVIDQIVKKTKAHELLALIADTHNAEPHVTVVMEQEPGSASAALIESLQFAIGSPTTKAKAVRAAITARHIRDSRVILCDRPWTKDLIDEMAQFPNGSHDDRVDSLVHGVNYLAGKEVMLWGF